MEYLAVFYVVILFIAIVFTTRTWIIYPLIPHSLNHDREKYDVHIVDSQ
ncbi:protein of unknown function [Xenorhabdus poinarii G6]|uniref:Uncharacterized protein n=1 Tax=Xenorhabdus poinarii G6 TaxID=1354304 RepID=A0A068QZX5_9GAMM|nr:protein of unknown function [Xenorhabdus poinarii G6]